MKTNKEIDEAKGEIKKDIEERSHERFIEQMSNNYQERMSGYGE